VKRRILFAVMLITVLCVPARGETIKWVDFGVPYASLKYAMDADISSAGQEKHLSWIDILAVSACRTGGKCDLNAVKQAHRNLQGDQDVEEILGNLYQYYPYYKESFTGVLGGLLGHFEIEVDGEMKPTYGLKAFSPIAAGYPYTHCDDFGNRRTFGFARKHLGHDMMGGLGTPIVAVESGIVEAMGWNRYGGWRIGIRSSDNRRYYYYVHLQKDHPFADGLEVGDVVQAGDLIGFMGKTGYSDKENTNNIETVHLHFGIQLIFEESQKECLSEIWIDPYNIVRLLHSHRSSIQRQEGIWKRVYPFVDLDIEPLLTV
jgi:murein DD-endopeptidase MepM/ murein hydrolase activator NlpD